MSSVSKTGRAWRQSNPILKKGEKGIESDTTLFKIGDGISPWTSLNYSQASMADVTELAAGLATKANSVDLASEITDREAADDSLTAMIATKVDNATLTATVNSAVVLRQLDPLRYDSTRLRAFRAALGARETTPVDILCVGDSVTEGQGSTTQSRRWIERMRDRVRAAFQPAGVVGGEGYIAGFFHSAGVTDRFTQTIATMTAREDLGGLGERTITLTGTNASATVTFTGTGIDILYAKGTTAGDFTWKIDAGGETTVSAFNAVISGGNVVQIRGLSATSHTLTIKRVTSSTYIEGVMVYNGDETSGIRLWEGSHSGWQSDDLATPGTITWYDSITPIQPDLVTICLGLNDYRSSSQPRLTPAQTKTNIQTLISGIRAKCTVPPSIILMIPYEPTVSPAPLAPWSEYRTAIEEVAQTDGAIALLDLDRHIGSLASSDPYDLDAGDLLHPNDRGHQLIADAVSGLMTEMV